jgi:hypothetical protein
MVDLRMSKLYMHFILRIPLTVTHIHFPYRSNETKYDLVFLEALVYQSYHGLIHHVGSPPVIGVLSYESFWTAAEAVGTPTNPAFISNFLVPYGNHMTFYERLQNTLFSSSSSSSSFYGPVGIRSGCTAALGLLCSPLVFLSALVH